MNTCKLVAENFATHRQAGGSVREWAEAGLVEYPVPRGALDVGYSPLPVIAGGAINNPTAHPLAPPTITGQILNINLFLQQPTRVTKVVRDLSLQRFVLDRFFNSAGGVSGGAVIYDVVQYNDLFTARDIEMVAPGAEFPIVTSVEQVPAVAVPEKWGAKTFILDEAIKRNDVSKLMQELRRLTNAIVRKSNQRAMGIVDAAVTANSRSVAGHNWTTAIIYGTSPTNPQLTPAADLNNAQRQADVEEMGIRYDTIIWNPVDATTFRNLYQGQSSQVLSDAGFREAYATNRVPANSAYLVASGELGELRLEKPLSTERWREPEIQAEWIQTDSWPVMYVNNPFAILKLTNLAG